MKDAKGNEMQKGWYWYNHANENDIFYPCYFDGNQIKIDKEWFNAKQLMGLDFYRAEMPIVN